MVNAVGIANAVDQEGTQVAWTGPVTANPVEVKAGVSLARREKHHLAVRAADDAEAFEIGLDSCPYEGKDSWRITTTTFLDT